MWKRLGGWVLIKIFNTVFMILCVVFKSHLHGICQWVTGLAIIIMNSFLVKHIPGSHIPQLLRRQEEIKTIWSSWYCLGFLISIYTQYTDATNISASIVAVQLICGSLIQVPIFQHVTSYSQTHYLGQVNCSTLLLEGHKYPLLILSHGYINGEYKVSWLVIADGTAELK